MPVRLTDKRTMLVEGRLSKIVTCHVSRSNPGNGEYWAELCRGAAVIKSYVRAHQFPDARALLRLNGQ
jgi:hypothetical protein